MDEQPSTPSSKQEPRQTNPWVITTILLAAISFGLLGINAYMVISIFNGATIGGGGGTVAPPAGDVPAPSGPVAVSVDDDPALGSANAPVTVIEFSDLQCPFCRRHFTDTYSQIKKDYIDTGKIRYVFRDFPLSFHPQAQVSAEAAECADEQGKFWEFHDKIFTEQNKQGTGTVTFTVDDIKKWGAEISGMDAAKFNSCVDSGKYKQEVQSDFNAGSAAGVSGTPTFYICKGTSNCQELVGAQPYAAFQQVINQQLA
ncbi:MAG: DsbA family protein [Candidatus Aenigmarchaeota archaeon]|nr:DsbA family protein [Candidatus Aenigmarchaeota archaeon]